MGLPPLDPWVKAMDTCVLPGVATRLVGASGGPSGVTDILFDIAPRPTRLIALNLI